MTDASSSNLQNFRIPPPDLSSSTPQALVEWYMGEQSRLASIADRSLHAEAVSSNQSGSRKRKVSYEVRELDELIPPDGVTGYSMDFVRLV